MFPLVQTRHHRPEVPLRDFQSETFDDDTRSRSGFSLTTFGTAFDAHLPMVPDRDAVSSRGIDRLSATATGYPPLVGNIPRASRPVSLGLGDTTCPQPDQYLRRKTPGGTIDAGYDVSSSHLPHASSRPLKHVIVPGQDAGYVESVARRAQAAAASSYSVAQVSLPLPHQAPATPMGAASMSYFVPSLSGSSGQYGAFASAAGLALPILAPTVHFPAAGMPHQASNLGGYEAAVVQGGSWPEALIPAGLDPVPQAFGTRLETGAGTEVFGGLYSQSSGPPSQLCMRLQADPACHLAMPSLLGLVGGDKCPPTSLQTPAYAGNLNIDGLSLHSDSTEGSLGRRFQSGDPSRFQQRVLAQAHRSYLDLLAHLHGLRSTSRPKPAGSQLLKPYVYLKPPCLNPWEASSCDVGNEAPVVSPNAIWGQIPASSIGTSSLAHLTPTRGHLHGEAAVQQSFGYGSPHSSHRNHALSPQTLARNSLAILETLCEQSGWSWIEGLLLGGCLYHGLEQHEEALRWFSRILAIDSSRVEAISNVAATLYCLDRLDEAESHWLRAIRMRPAYLEASEQLISLLYRKRCSEAVAVIDYVQSALRLSPGTAHAGTTANSTTREGRGRGSVPLADTWNSPAMPRKAAGFGSSGYAIPGGENGRMLALVHAKATMLYGMKDISRAAETFEEAVLISTGRAVRCVGSLVFKIQQVLTRFNASQTGHVRSANPLAPLLLHPGSARNTAQLVFSAQGDLPGLFFICDRSLKRAAIQTTSNSLLSLAKIFQDSLSSGGTGTGVHTSGVGDILALYYLSLSLQESPSTANNVGILLAGIQQPQIHSPPGTRQETHPMAAPGSLGIAAGSGLELALAYYNYGLSLDPKHVHLHTNYGSLLKDLGFLDAAIHKYEQAVSCDGTFDIALTNLANAVKDKGRIRDAIKYYRRAVASNPNFPEAVCGLSTALNSVCDWRGRGGVVLNDGLHDRWHVGEDGSLDDVRVLRRGSGLLMKVVDIVRRQLEDASKWGAFILQADVAEQLARHSHSSWASQMESSVDFAEALQRWTGKPWEGSRVVRLVERCTRNTMRAWYCDRVAGRDQERRVYQRPRLPSSLSVPSAPTVLPFHTFTCPLTAREIRLISQRNALRISCSTLKAPWIPDTVYPPPRTPSPHFNVGYVSSDFNNHPLAHLMQSVFGLHNTAKVKAFCYATTPSDRSVHRHKIEREAPVFRDVSNWASDKIVEQITRDEIHILVNLNGYTRGARNDIFAARPAPVQMSFMGFAGTLGAEWCDYILADGTAVPASTLRPWRSNSSPADVFRDGMDDGDQDNWVYSENIIFFRSTFFCCDHAQSCDAEDRTVSWEGEKRRRWRMRKSLFPGLADDAVILGNFNQLYKIEPSTFRMWLRILSRVPKAILWLLKFPDLGEENLKRTAVEWAGSDVAARVVFTEVAPKHLHISRARVCDLFLDTPECNAHTTAADVLWSSTPLLTLPRYTYKMCSRMAASILKGALPRSDEGNLAARELVASSEDEYEAFATRLAAGVEYSRCMSSDHFESAGRLMEIRKLLFESRWKCALFDTGRWVSDLERAYDEAWNRWVSGRGGDIVLD